MKFTKDPIEFDATDFYMAGAVICAGCGMWITALVLFAMCIYLASKHQEYVEQNMKDEDK
ncbi:MAG: hypothetical protein AB7F40_04540 [Victivallaceae bacterium]